jgi:hypothetical protein
MHENTVQSAMWPQVADRATGMVTTNRIPIKEQKVERFRNNHWYCAEDCLLINSNFWEINRSATSEKLILWQEGSLLVSQ